MSTVSPEAHVAAIARQHPATIAVFERHRIDFCCGGKRPLAEACAELGLEETRLLAELQVAADGPQPERDWSDATRSSSSVTSSRVTTRPCGATCRWCSSWRRRWRSVMAAAGRRWSRSATWSSGWPRR